MQDFIAPLRDLHRRRIEPVTGKPEGASASEIAALSEALGERLPQAYVQFLLWMGKDYSGIYRGTDIFIKHVLDNTEALPELLAENDIAPLTGKQLCYQSHQGYFMAWFALPAESDDPQVFVFGEGQNLSEPRAVGTFTQYMLRELTDLAKIGGSAADPG